MITVDLNNSSDEKTNMTNQDSITSDTRKSVFKDPGMLIKAFQIMLTFFYGLFIANAISDKLIPRTDDASVFAVIKILMGGINIIITVFSLIVVWRKKTTLIFYLLL